MYSKVLIPLDGSEESESAIPLIKKEMGDETEVILLRVLHPVKTQVMSGQTILGSQKEESERLTALSYLKGVIGREGSSEKWSSETIISKSVADGIIDVASRENADLIAMYHHKRGGLTRILKGSTTKGVIRHASVEVRTFSESDIESHAAVS